ncbi:MAG: TIGR02757 family protein [Bacteroidales bacterium]|nr:TIGR02757 family protein [Bacteroidales bacterium]
MRLKKEELKEFLDEKVDLYNRPEFIDHDPISIPHLFTKKEDIEISAFLTATIAWGNRMAIINNAGRMMQYLDNSPYEFIMKSSGSDLKRIKGVIHRTFDSSDLVYFIKALRHIYNTYNGMEGIFMKFRTDDSLQPAIHMLKKHFFELQHGIRTEKHISDPFRGSAAKKINMFLRWMVRKDNRGVDFGLWKSMPASILSCPLDVHSGNVARELGLLKRKQNDAKAVAELDLALRSLDNEDPVKYDFALFGLGAIGKFI